MFGLIHSRSGYVEETAGTDLDAFAAFVAVIEVDGEILSGAGLLQLRETAGCAVHVALLAAKT